MKTFNNYIQEKLVINKSSKVKKIIVHNKAEFRKAVNDIMNASKDFENVDLTSIDVSNMVDMTRLLVSYNTIKTLDVSTWDVSHIKSMSYIFPSSLENVDLSNWDVSEVQNMTGMFYNCKNLKDIGDISNWKTNSLINTSEMFCNCENLKSIDISTWNLSKLENINRMFYGCKELESIGNITREQLINSSVKSYKTEVFLYCKKLKK